MKPRTGSASKCYTFSHTAAGSSSNLATLDQGAIVATVDGEHEPLANGASHRAAGGFSHRSHVPQAATAARPGAAGRSSTGGTLQTFS